MYAALFLLFLLLFFYFFSQRNTVFTSWPRLPEQEKIDFYVYLFANF